MSACDKRHLFFTLAVCDKMNMVYLQGAITGPRSLNKFGRIFMFYYNENEQLGQGHFGVVFAGRLNDEDVAVKRIKISENDSAAFGDTSLYCARNCLVISR